MIGVAFEPSEPGIDLLAELKSTFLANDASSFGGSVGLIMPLTNARLTQAEIIFHTAYDYGRRVPAWSAVKCCASRSQPAAPRRSANDWLA
jgi:hypothetical protein